MYKGKQSSSLKHYTKSFDFYYLSLNFKESYLPVLTYLSGTPWAKQTKMIHQFRDNTTFAIGDVQVNDTQV